MSVTAALIWEKYKPHLERDGEDEEVGCINYWQWSIPQTTCWVQHFPWACRELKAVQLSIQTRGLNVGWSRVEPGAGLHDSCGSLPTWDAPTICESASYLWWWNKQWLLQAQRAGVQCFYWRSPPPSTGREGAAKKGPTAAQVLLPSLTQPEQPLKATVPRPGQHGACNRRVHTHHSAKSRREKGGMTTIYKQLKSIHTRGSEETVFRVTAHSMCQPRTALFPLSLPFCYPSYPLPQFQQMCSF